jgi:hypothetical protein
VRVLGERFRDEDIRVVHQDIDRAETLHRGRYDLLGRRGQTDITVNQALASGELIRLLPNWASAQIPVFAVYSSRKFLPLRLSVFLEALAAWKSPLWLRD